VSLARLLCGLVLPSLVAYPLKTSTKLIGDYTVVDHGYDAVSSELVVQVRCRHGLSEAGFKTGCVTKLFPVVTPLRRKEGIALRNMPDD
jgi:hypothetical protein